MKIQKAKKTIMSMFVPVHLTVAIPQQVIMNLNQGTYHFQIVKMRLILIARKSAMSPQLLILSTDS
ncbi:MAG: hypothetical protein LUQ50_05355 [Methanospirillum sp.]|uniref:hypothetical protein n=1 Tax=Methanospirillum sp. TaxID=45200 RepID=UPI0023761408|nr:hypothetical protein [Methanospirillum sp.]MDD1728480.1 hypothetical protein [Methanospirillum sp.]